MEDPQIPKTNKKSSADNINFLFNISPPNSINVTFNHYVLKLIINRHITALTHMDKIYIIKI